MPRTTVAVTGAAGYIGRRLVERLCSDGAIERVIGFDVRPIDFTHPKLLFDSVDVRDQALEARLTDVDVVVHLAFVMDPIHDENAMRDVNVNGSQNVFRCAGRAGVGTVVYTSSALVYGAHPDNDFPLTEESPLRANLDFSYAAHKLEVEYVVREVQDEFPELKFTVFRPAIVFGPNVDNAWSHTMELPVLFNVQGYQAPLQFVHQDDVAEALHFAITTDLEGIYNLAPDNWVEHDDMVKTLARRTVALAEPMAFELIDRLWSLKMAEAPAGILHYVMHPWVVSPKKLEAAGFTCSRSSRDVFAETAARAANFVRIGHQRVNRRDLRRGVLTGAGVLAALVTLRTAKKRLAIRQ